MTEAPRRCFAKRSPSPEGKRGGEEAACEGRARSRSSVPLSLAFVARSKHTKICKVLLCRQQMVLNRRICMQLGRAAASAGHGNPGMLRKALQAYYSARVLIMQQHALCDTATQSHDRGAHAKAKPRTGPSKPVPDQHPRSARSGHCNTIVVLRTSAKMRRNYRQPQRRRRQLQRWPQARA